MNDKLKTLVRIVPVLTLAAMTAAASVVRLAWDPPVLPAGASPVTNYLVEYRSGTQTNWSATNTGTNLSVEITIDDRLVWSFRAYAASARGISPPTPELRLMAIPNPPRNFTATLLDITGAVQVLSK